LRITQAIQAAAAIIAGIFITFSQMHDALIGNIGLVILATGFAISTAILIFKNESRVINTIRFVFYIALIGFAIYLIVQFDQLWFYALMFVNGFFEIGKLFNSKPGSPERKDVSLNVLINFGLIAAVSVSGFVSGIDPVAFVGFFGAYAIILGVHLGIASASPNGIASASPKA
jgi:hypothetical protein